MLDKEQYREKQNKIANYREKIKVLEEIKKDIEILIKTTQKECLHDLVVCYSKNNDEVKSARCLICDSYLELKDTLELHSEKYIKEQNIIYISDYTQSLDSKYDNELIIMLKEQLNFILDNCQNVNNDLIKDILINEIKKYDSEKQYKKLLKKDEN